jgi:hypothetical protein
MARRSIYLHIGLPDCGLDKLDRILRRHEDVLAGQGIRLPAASAQRARRAALEIRRTHREAGYRRRDVEGTWAEICRRAFKHKGVSLVVQEDLAAAAPDQVALLLDGLAGFRTHVAVTAGQNPDDLEDALERWAPRIRPERLHVIDGGTSADEQARTLGRIVGFDLEGGAGTELSATARRPRRKYAS